MFKFALLCFILIVNLQITQAQVKGKNPDEAKSVVLLDAFTINKIIPSPNLATVILVSQKSQFGDYGTQSIRTDYLSYAFFAQTNCKNDSNVLFSQVIVNGGDNLQLAMKLGLDPDFKHPALFLIPPGKTLNQARQYPTFDPYQFNDMSRFLMRYTTLTCEVPGLIRTLQPYVESIVKKGKSIHNIIKKNEIVPPEQISTVENIIEALKQAVAEETLDQYKQYGQIYVEIAEEFVKNSFDITIFAKELKNLTVDLDKILPKETILGFRRKVNVLKIFNQYLSANHIITRKTTPATETSSSQSSEL